MERTKNILSFPNDSRHSAPMTKRPTKSSSSSSLPEAEGASSGFGEAPQPALSGSPLSGSVSDWADQIADEDLSGLKARKEAEQPSEEKVAPKKKAAAKPAAKKPAAKAKKAPAKSARGTSMGATSDPRERAKGGLNPVAGLDISLEDAEKLLDSHVKETKKKKKKAKEDTITGATATVQALARLIEQAVLMNLERMPGFRTDRSVRQSPRVGFLLFWNPSSSPKGTSRPRLRT